jgi:hypothetical protein
MNWKGNNEQMAKLKKNAVISGLSGALGKDHYARHRKDGNTIICEKPDFSNRQFSEAQLNVQSGMSAAAAYATVASKQNPIYAELAKKKAKKKVRNAYNVAVGDWFKAPVINRIECHHGHIRVLASDDVMVTKVTVTILGEAGQRLEQAEAQLNLGVWWEYQAANSGLVRVEAWDFASNVTRQEFRPSQSNWYWEKLSWR